MRILLTAFILSLLLCASATRLAAQEASKIIDQYLKAAGGSKTLARLQTLSLDGVTSSTRSEKSGTYTFAIKQPNRYYSEFQNEGRTSIEAYNGKSAWHQTDNGSFETLLGTEALEVEAAAQYYNSHLEALSKRKIGASYRGNVSLRGHDSYELALTFPSGISWEVYFDTQSHLIVAEKATIAGVAREFDYDDYRTVGGIKLPHHLEIHRGEEVVSVDLIHAAVNGTVGERVFDFPVKSQVKLPDLKTLFEQIDANQKQIDKIKENYAGTQIEDEIEYDKNERVAKRESREYTFFYLSGEEITTLVKKNGKALSSEEARKESEKTQKRIEELQKKEKKKEEKAEKAKEEGKETQDKGDPGIEIFLRVCQFVNPRRERFRGQDVLVFDFEPNPEYKPKNLEERVVKELAGVVWIDEKALDVARLEAYFIGDVRLAGGLVANLQKGTSFTFEQAFINNEV